MNDEMAIDEIMYIHHSNDNLKIYYSFDKCYENICPYYTLLKLLNDKFLRINDYTIVNFDFVAKCKDDFVTLKNQMTFELSDKYKKEVTNKFFKMKLERFTANS